MQGYNDMEMERTLPLTSVSQYVFLVDVLLVKQVLVTSCATLYKGLYKNIWRHVLTRQYHKTQQQTVVLKET